LEEVSRVLGEGFFTRARAGSSVWKAGCGEGGKAGRGEIDAQQVDYLGAWFGFDNSAVSYALKQSAIGDGIAWRSFEGARSVEGEGGEQSKPGEKDV